MSSGGQNAPPCENRWTRARGREVITEERRKRKKNFVEVRVPEHTGSKLAQWKWVVGKTQPLENLEIGIQVCFNQEKDKSRNY